MTAVDHAAGHASAEAGWLSRERTVAKPGFNRWLVPPAALCIHLSIGMAYALSVFWKPLAKVIPGDDAACKGIGFFQLLTSTTCNWPDTVTVKAFETAIVILGISAALFGGWLERAGPRKAGLVAAFCWGGGFLISALAVHLHQLWLLYVGLGLVGGVGLGLGYISPVSTLIKWFPDRRGMATGMAIMGFGGGAMIGAPLANLLMSGGAVVPGLTVAGFKSASGQPGVIETFLTLGIVYFVVMCIGAMLYRVPPENWAPDGYVAPAKTNRFISSGDVHLDDAHKTMSFWMIWGVLFLNVTAGIAVLSIASPMLQTIFGPSLIGLPPGAKPNGDQLKAIAAVAAGFVGLLSLFNIGGRFFWASMSDKIGRKVTYFTFFVLGMALYAAVPTLADHGLKAPFVGALCIILSMYGGGFATVPAYLADIFGTKFVGAIHGRLLTAWSAAGVVGSEIIVGVRDHEIAAGVPKTQVYDAVMYVMVALLALGFVCNLLVRPVDPKWHDDHELGNEKPHRSRRSAASYTAPLTALGAIVGFAIGCLTSPTFLGIQIPLSVITSSAPGDAPFRNQLIIHLGTITLIGAVVLGIIGKILSSISAKSQPADSVSSNQNVSNNVSLGAPSHSSQGIGKGALAGPALVPWLIIAIPVAWGLYKALLSAAKILT